MNEHSSNLRARPFRDEARHPGGLTGVGVADLLRIAGDLALALDPEGVVVDFSASGPALVQAGLPDWVGRPLIELVTIESRPKISELLTDAKAGKPMRWRQVNHPLDDGDMPVRYAALANEGGFLVLGRDVREAGALQQRLIQAQQSLERDYLRLRQAETRYRLLFDQGDEPVLIVDVATRRIDDANQAAHRLLGAKPDTLARQPVTAIAAAADAEALIAHLGASAAAGQVAPVTIRLLGGRSAQVSAIPFRQDRATLLLVRLMTVDAGAAAADDGAARLAQVIEQMPDGFVLTDRRMIILSANAAFCALAEAPSPEMVVGEPLGRWLGRPGIDLELIGGQLREHGAARNISTILRGSAGGQEEVETSAVVTDSDDGAIHGFTIRGVARRLRDLAPVDRDLPRSVEQLTELVGRVSLKDIVRESTDLIERLCIDAALAYTSDNRASAAEILGLSRQSLYSKLHRHGLGNLVDERD